MTARRGYKTGEGGSDVLSLQKKGGSETVLAMVKGGGGGGGAQNVLG